MQINFLYVSDNGYFDLMRLSIISAIKYHKGAIFHVFTMDSPETKQRQISTLNKDKLERESSLLDPTAEILYYDVRELYLQKLANSVNKNTRFSPYAALRLLTPYIIRDVDMLLYIDSDTIVTDSLEELFYEYCCKDFDFAATAYYKGDAMTFLSGSILLNLEYQRQTNFIFVDDAIRHYNTFEYEFPDQDAITRAKKKAIILQGRYMQQEYDFYTKVFCICYRKEEPVRNFLKQSIFRMDAQKIHKKTKRIAQVVSDIQNPR